VRSEILDNGPNVFPGKFFTANLRTHGVQTGGWAGDSDVCVIAGFCPQAPHCGLRHADFLWLQLFEAIGDKDTGDYQGAVDVHLHLAEAGQSFGSQRNAVARQNDDVLTNGIKADWPNLQRERISWRSPFPTSAFPQEKYPRIVP
jgi:hypothetical protein